jgi:hypothetical protein
MEIKATDLWPLSICFCTPASLTITSLNSPSCAKPLHCLVHHGEASSVSRPPGVAVREGDQLQVLEDADGV